MALPTNLAAKIKSIPMDPTALATEPELSYLLSFAHHRTRRPTQPSHMTRSTPLRGRPRRRRWRITPSRTSRTRRTISCKRRPRAATRRAVASWSAASAAASSSSTPAPPPTSPPLPSASSPKSGTRPNASSSSSRTRRRSASRPSRAITRSAGPTPSANS